ncbi:MAG: EpsG family protein [Acidobacteria bacterium]|nr:EpsG family protein [Acidobacteriota bacterium]
MLIYFGLLAFVTGIAMLARKAPSRGVFRASYAAIVAALVIVPGIRSAYVGTDAGSYISYFERTRTFGDVLRSTLEPGYFLLAWVANLVSNNYASIFFLVAFVVATCYVWTIRRWSVSPVVSLFTLLVSGGLFVSWNGARQGLAAAVYFIALGPLIRRRFWPYAMWVAVATAFHRTAIVALPAYFLATRKGGVKTRLVIAALGGVGIWSFDFLVELGSAVEQRYAVYAARVTTGRGLLVLAFTCAICAFFLVFRRSVTHYRPVYDVLLNTFMLGTTIAVATAVAGTGASGVRRLSLYFLASEILLWPIVVVNMRHQQQRDLFLYAFGGLYLVYFGLTLRAFGDLVPFLVNPLFTSWASAW